MRRIFLVFAAALAFLPPMAWSQDAATALEGAWVVSVGDQPRDRFLIVRGASVDKGEVLVKSAVYGWIDGKGRQVGDWKAEIAGDTIKLSFVTPSDSVVKVAFSAVDTSVSGDMLTKTGRKFDVRMTRLDAEELEAMRAAAATAAAGAKAPPPAAKSGIRKDSTISLVYVGADDCGSCVRWASYYGNGVRLKEITPELADARFVRVKLSSYRDPVTAGRLPDDLKWLIESGAAGKAPMRKRGTPFFAAVVDKRITAQGHGTAALEALVAPAIKRAVEERRAAN
jgi:hypothetical protein